MGFSPRLSGPRLSRLGPSIAIGTVRSRTDFASSKREVMSARPLRTKVSLGMPAIRSAATVDAGRDTVPEDTMIWCSPESTPLTKTWTNCICGGTASGAVRKCEASASCVSAGPSARAAPDSSSARNAAPAAGPSQRLMEDPVIHTRPHGRLTGARRHGGPGRFRFRRCRCAPATSARPTHWNAPARSRPIRDRRAARPP